MRNVLFAGMVSCLCLHAAIEHRVTGIVGAHAGYKGYTTWLKLEHAWYDAYTITAVDVTTNRMTAPGLAIAEGALVRVFSDSGNIPSVLNPTRFYLICNITAGSFQLSPDLCGGQTIDLTDTGSGTLKVGTPNQTVATPSVYIKNITLPTGVTAGQISCVSYDCLPVGGGKYQSISGGSEFWLRLDIAATAPSANGTVSLTIETNGYPDRTFTIPFTINDLVPIPSQRPSSIPAVPNKANWESQMVALAAQWCPDKANGTLAIGQLYYGYETGAWFYDGAWVYSQVADYTGDPQWRNCAKTIDAWYLDATLFVNGGHLGYKAFTDGLKRACSSCDGRHKVAILRTAQNMALSFTAGSVRDDYIRESAYVLEAQINAARAYGYRHLGDVPVTAPWDIVRARVQRGADQLLGQLNMVRNNNFIYQQTFMNGLAMRALIEYFNFTGDPRVPVEIKATLDYTWSQCWNRTDLFAAYANKELWANADAVLGGTIGPSCDYGCRNTNDGSSVETGLINLSVPAFAWYWWYSGDDTYRVRGDTIFQHSLDTPIDFSGKVFSQNYRWSFDYVSLREGRGAASP